MPPEVEVADAVLAELEVVDAVPPEVEVADAVLPEPVTIAVVPRVASEQAGRLPSVGATTDTLKTMCSGLEAEEGAEPPELHPIPADAHKPPTAAATSFRLIESSLFPSAIVRPGIVVDSCRTL